MLISQKITTKWTKLSRGMPLAQQRNAVPRTFCLPEFPLTGPHLIHEVYANESDGFKLSQECIQQPFPAAYWSLSYKTQADAIQVLFRYNYHQHGRPQRGEVTRPLFTLAKNETGVFWINGRYTSSRGQYYTQHCINMANLDVIKPKIFITSQPQHFVDKLANLF